MSVKTFVREKILEIFYSSESGYTVTEVAEKTDIKRQVMHNILVELKDAGKLKKRDTKYFAV